MNIIELDLFNRTQVEKIRILRLDCQRPLNVEKRLFVPIHQTIGNRALDVDRKYIRRMLQCMRIIGDGFIELTERTITSRTIEINERRLIGGHAFQKMREICNRLFVLAQTLKANATPAQGWNIFLFERQCRRIIVHGRSKILLLFLRQAALNIGAQFESVIGFFEHMRIAIYGIIEAPQTIEQGSAIHLRPHIVRF